MQQNRAWLISVKRQALVAMAVAVVAIALGLAPRAVVQGDAVCVPAPGGGCAGPTTSGGGGSNCINNICPGTATGSLSQSTGSMSQSTGNVQSTNQAAGGSAGTSAAPTPVSTACILPQTITGPLGAPGVGFPAGINSYNLSAATAGTYVVCQGSLGMQITGPAKAVVVVTRNGVTLNVTLDSNGAGLAASSAFPQ